MPNAMFVCSNGLGGRSRAEDRICCMGGVAGLFGSLDGRGWALDEWSAYLRDWPSEDDGHH